MTYSIVARDPETGSFGVAVQSRWFSVGRFVPWAEPGAGAVATQSFLEPEYGTRGLELMRHSLAAPDALSALVSVDPGAARRQVAMVDSQGRAAAHTGSGCVAACGHRVGEGFSVQANMMARETVWDAMAEAFAAAAGELADRLLAALDAAEAEGGDLRGRQSAALLVVAAVPTGNPRTEVLCDLRVEDALEPLAELRRLRTMQRAYDGLRRAMELAHAREFDSAIAESLLATEALPGDDQIAFWHALQLAEAGRVDEALPLLARAGTANAGWADFVGRLASAGVIPDEPKLLARMTAALKERDAS